MTKKTDVIGVCMATHKFMISYNKKGLPFQATHFYEIPMNVKP
ncbi:MAG: hypothetical protein VB022_02665 [Rikenellaceae bacterium]|nr:hypothetical protein [Rikenellaceae bacterium]